MRPLSLVAILALLGSSFVLTANIPGGSLLPPGSRGDRGPVNGAVSVAEQAAIDDNKRCSGDILGHCELEGFPLKDPTAFDMPQKRYVVRNIYAINNFFLNWYTAMEFATDQSARAIPQMIATLDPGKKADSKLGVILEALTIGLPFLSLPEVGALVPASTTAIGGLLVTALQQAPSVAQAIFTTDDDANQVVQIVDLASDLSKLNSDIGRMLDQGLAAIMNDPLAFAKFASSGSFSGPEILSIPDEKNKLDLAFKTFLVTRAMSANDWWVYWGPPDAANGTWFNSTLESNAQRFVCNTTPKGGICDTIDSRGVVPLCQPEHWGTYTSNVTHRAYYPSQQHGKNDPPSARLLHAIADNNWGTMETVFDGAYNCNVKNGGTSSPVFSVSDAGHFDFSCLSQLEIKPGCDKLDEGWQEGCNFFFERHKVPVVGNCWADTTASSLALFRRPCSRITKIAKIKRARNATGAPTPTPIATELGDPDLEATGDENGVAAPAVGPNTPVDASFGFALLEAVDEKFASDSVVVCRVDDGLNPADK
ncbi:MAG: hypothetical protein Q9218_005069 [Villophora microphyllina]